MGLLLISPPREVPQPADFPPMGLAYIASALKKEGVKCSVLDAASFSWQRLEKSIKDLKPDVVGVTCWTIERKQAFETMKLVRRCLPQVKLIVGGQHATAFPAHMFEVTEVDAVVLREGEATVLDLVRAFSSGKDISSINGIAYKRDGEVFVTEPRELIKDLDSIPFPSYDDFDISEYHGLREFGRAAAIITSRGCPYKCIYCSSANFWHRKWRYRSAQNVLDEIEWLHNDYQVKAFIFFDDLFAAKKDRAIEICRGILERNLRISWVAETRVNTVDAELLRWMKRAGCYRIDYGVESGSPRILKNIKKGIRVEQIREAFKMTHEAGILPRAFLMVGNPGESEETIQETINLMREVKPYDTASGRILWVLPNTEIYDLTKKQGIITDEFWLNNDSTMYYTGEHSLRELKALQNKLMLGLARNRGNTRAILEYYFRRAHNSSPIIQKIYHSWLVKNKGLYRWFNQLPFRVSGHD